MVSAVSSAKAMALGSCLRPAPPRRRQARLTIPAETTSTPAISKAVSASPAKIQASTATNAGALPRAMG